MSRALHHLSNLKAKIAIVDYLTSEVFDKDPVQITKGLIEEGHSVVFVPRNVVNVNKTIPFDIVQGELNSTEFWKNLNVDVCIFFSRLDPQVTDVCKAIKNAGIKLIIKADSDGTIGYPLKPNYLRIIRFRSHLLLAIARHIKWRLPIKFFVGKKLEHIDIADRVVFESPYALKNANKVLDYWGMSDKKKNLVFIPNPVSDDVVNRPVSEKKNKIVAIGRWDDEIVKNTQVLCNSLSEFLQENTEYEAVVIGSGQFLLRKYFSKTDFSLRITGVLDHEKIAEHLSDAKTLVMPSLLESFGLVAAEALCMGCSIVVTPLESLVYLSNNETTGVVSKGFSQKHILDALNADKHRWDNNFYLPEKISTYWRSSLNRRVVANQFSSLANQITKLK